MFLSANGHTGLGSPLQTRLLILNWQDFCQENDFPAKILAGIDTNTDGVKRWDTGAALGISLAAVLAPNRPVASGVGAVACFCRHHGKRKVCEKPLPQGGVLPERRATPWGPVGETGLSPERAY